MLPSVRNRGFMSAPLSALDEVRNEMDRLFGSALPTWTQEAWAMPTDVRETAEALEFTTEVPGLNPSDIELTVENGVLTIAGEKKDTRKEEGEHGYRLVERRYGRFERSFRVPSTVEADKVSARCENGVLTITLPKAEKARPRRIQVQVSDGSREVQTGSRS
jgi:HSP20 family protein